MNNFRTFQATWLLVALSVPVAGADKAPELLAELVGKLQGGLANLESVLDRYNRIESAGKMDIFERHAIHRGLLKEISARRDPALDARTRAYLGRTEKSTFPARVLMLKVFMGREFPAPEAERALLLEELARGKDARLATWAMRLLAESRWSGSVEALLRILAAEERAGKFDGLIAQQATSELFRILGAEAIRGGSGKIREAWEKMKMKVPASPAYTLGAGAVATGTFFGDRISPRSVFCLDASSSMLERVSRREASTGKTAVGPEKGKKSSTRKRDEEGEGWGPLNGGGELKIDVAKKELVQVLKSLQPSFQFNILTYNSTYYPWQSRGSIKLVEAKASAVESACSFVSSLKTDQFTNIHDTIAAALEVPGVDTVYLLSDGVPTKGGSPADIERRVGALNYLLGARVLTYGFTSEKAGDFDEEFMKRLARDNWGWYRRLNR